MKYPILFFLAFLALDSLAQFQDNFSDGDFADNPIWQGDTADFIVNDSLELQLKGKEEGGISQLRTIAPTAGETNWEFLVQLDFKPSANNFASVYLAADQSDLTGAVNGYYVKIGGISGDLDAIELYQQTGTESSLLISGEAGGVGTEPALARIRVERDAASNWQLLVDYEGGTNYVLQGTSTDATYDLLDYFGLLCTYTSSRSDQFFFDDIFIDPLFTDTTPPSLQTASPVSSFEIDLSFSEPLLESSVLESAFSIDNMLGIASASLDASDLSLVHLTLDGDMINGENYTITANAIQDLEGNILSNESANFAYVEVEIAAAYDIIVNELMIDPSPVVGLPDGEFIELYNRSDKIFNLKDYSISSGSSPVSLEDFLLYPDSYVVLCKPDIASTLASFGDVLVVDNLPGLSNEVDIFILFNDLGEVVDNIFYVDSYYGSSSKAKGGWTLERINPNNPCTQTQQFAAAVAFIGGTPGTVNSILADEPDQSPPVLISAVPISTNQVVLGFDEILNNTNSTNPALFFVDNNISVTGVSISGTKVTLDIVDSLKVGVFYTVEVSEIHDCVGNGSTVKQGLSFALPSIPTAKDIIINEILFNPETNGFDFVELYNCSDKLFNLKDLYIADLAKEDIEQIETDFLLFPDSYAVLTLSKNTLLEQYSVPNPNAIITMPIPTFSNESGNVSLYRLGDEGALILDAFDYTEDFHTILLDDVDGVSLERIDPKAPTQSMENWHSAGSLVGYATPTYQNSQSLSRNLNKNNLFSLPETTFSPDSDGYKDFLQINYQMDAPGWSATIQLFDARGRLVRNLKSGAILGTEGSIKWDGAMDNGTKAPIGIYVLWIEALLPDGRIERFKEVCVVAANLD